MPSLSALPRDTKMPISIFDIQGLLISILLMILGILLLKSCGLVTGQTAGLALLLSYSFDLPFGPLLFALSVVPLWFAYTARGLNFTIRSLCVIFCVSFGTPLLGRYVTFDTLDPLIAALFAGCSLGVGVMGTFRHNASIGGLGALALLTEQKTGLKTGYFQLLVDTAIFSASLFVLALPNVLFSFIAASVMAAVLAFNFQLSQSGTGRPGR